MKRSMIQQRSTTRRGAVLIVVLSMLALFAVIGLSFVLYAESQANMADSNKRALNETGSFEAFLEVQPEQAAELWLGNLIYGVGDTGDELMNPLRGHGLAEGKYGRYRVGSDPSLSIQPSLFPFAGQAVPAETLPFNVPVIGPMDRRSIVNYMWDTTNNFVIDPERLYNGSIPRPAPGAPFVGTYVNGAVPYTYPDRQANFFLALQDQTTGEIVAPSFYRPDLLQTKDPTAGGINDLYTLCTTSQTQLLNNATYAPILQNRLKTVRPTHVNHPNFPAVPQNPDGTYTGDVQNMKFLNISQKNDSFWMDAGGPVLTIRGRKVKAMVAPLILDLSSKVNLSIAGNMRAVQPGNGPGQVPTGARHTSHEGIGPWEINPRTVAPNLTDAQFLALMQKRFPNPPGGTYQGTQIDQTLTRQPPYARNGLTGTLNDGQLPPLHSGFSSEGVTTTPIGTPDPMLLPLATQTSLFPTFPGTRFPNTGSAAPMLYTDRLYSHPHLFNPLLYRRGSNNANATWDRPFGLDHVVTHNARVNDGKSRWATTEIGNVSPLPATSGGFNNPTDRLMTTGFSVTQQLPMLPIRTGPNLTDFTNLGPIDINRTLPDYRKNTQIPLSPLNMWNPALLAEQQNFFRARQARQTLARDIFIRLAAFAVFNAGSPAIDGTLVRYDVTTGYLTITILPTTINVNEIAQMTALRNMAQLAANIVDFIDHDDIATAFVWNPDTTQASWGQMVAGTIPMDPSLEPANFNNPATIGYRAVYGTELPKLVLNEVYSAVANDRTDMGLAAMNPLKRRYYIELFNPMPADATRPDSGATRLKYQSGVTQLQDPANPTGPPITFTSATPITPYLIEISTSAPSVPGTPQIPFSVAMNANPLIAAVDHATTPVPGMTLQARINNFIHDATAPAPMTNLGGDDFNVVRPFAAGAVQGSNNGFYVLGPRDPLTPTTQHSVSLFDAAVAPTPAAPVDALLFDATPAAPTDAQITTEAGKTSVIMLRRLMNPYIGYDPVLNPYITVDYLENIPTRDKATKTSNPMMPHTPPVADATAGSQGRVHPYAAAPTYGSTLVPPATLNGVNDQTSNAAAMQPSHSMFAHNDSAQLNRADGSGATKGFEWMTHFDRKLINSMELLHVGITPPALMTQRFALNNPAFGGANTDAFAYQYHTRANVPGAALPYFLDSTNAPNYYKLLDFLTCGNTLPGTPIGWREPGKMNPNGFTRPELFLAVTDPQLGNSFDASVSQFAWNGVPGSPRLQGTRTPNYNLMTPFVRGTSDETTTAGDRPYKAFSAAANYDETLLRGLPGTPYPGQLMTERFTPLTFDRAHPYLQYEQLRKSWNNLTPVSDSFLVIMTVGFFEVENDVAYSVTAPPQIGKEVFNVTPGDLRVQFAGIVDRSNLIVPIVTVPTPGPPPPANLGQVAFQNPAYPLADAKPWSVKLVEDAHPGSSTITIEAVPVIDAVTPSNSTFGVNVDGDMIYVPGNLRNALRIGHGDSLYVSGDGEPIVIPLAGAPAPPITIDNKRDAFNVIIPNQVVLTLNTPLTRYHAAGSPVSNTVLGNPGPQTVKPTLPKLKARNVVPYFTRLYP